MNYKTVGFQLKLDKAEKVENMFYYIANKKNEKIKSVQKNITEQVKELGGVEPNLRSLFKPNNQIFYDIIEEEYLRLGGKLWGQ